MEEEEEKVVEEKTYLPEISLGTISALFGLFLTALNIYIGMKQLNPTPTKSIPPPTEEKKVIEKTQKIFGMEQNT